MLTPLEIEKVRFKKAVTGYDMKQVNDFMYEVSETLQEYMNEIEYVRKKNSQYEFELEKYRELENTLSETLVIAKRTSEDIVNSARKEASNILEKANFEAAEAKRDIDMEISTLKLKKTTLENEVLSFKSRVRSILESQLATIDRIDLQ